MQAYYLSSGIYITAYMIKNKRVKNSFGILKDTYREFRNDKVLKLSAALAYYTVFSLPALFLVIISLTGFFFGQEAVEGVLFGQLNDIMGNKAALQVQDAIRNTHLSGNSYIGTILGGITLVLSATGIFGEIQDTINLIWGLRAKPRKGFLKLILNRMLSFSLILSIGFALLVSLVVSSLLEGLSAGIADTFPQLNITLLLVLDYIIQLAGVTYLFAIIFKVLPDAKIKWRDVIKGAVFTAVLFMIGKLILGYLISRNSVTEAYGAAGSILILLLWVYYSSAILYIGAEFTQVYAMQFGSRITPNKYAVWVENQVVEQPSPLHPQQEDKKKD